MNTPPELPESSLLLRFLRWLFSWRIVRRALLTLVALITLLVLVVTEENYRGKRAWQRYKSEQVALGEQLDLKSFIPPPIPDDRNLAMTPLLKPLHEFVKDPVKNQYRQAVPKSRIHGLSATQGAGDRVRAPGSGSLEKGNLVDLAAWQNFYRGNTNYPQPSSPLEPAHHVLTALAKFDAELAELQAAAVARPDCRFNLPYDDDCPFAILLPHLGGLKAPCSVLSLRATARIASGQTDAALSDIRLGLRLSDGVRQEPVLISHLVRMAMIQVALQPVAEGLARHAWTDAQLADLDKMIGSVDVLAEYQWAMRGERAFSMAGLDWMKRASLKDLNMLGNGSADQGGLDWKGVIPSGFIDHNKVHIAALHSQFTLAVIDAKSRRAHPEYSDAMDKTCQKPTRSPYKIMASLLMPAVSKCAQRTAALQTLLDQLRVACALERSRLAAGSYPDALDSLAPRYLPAVPQDILSGQPLIYRKPGQTYLLYSVGWNQRDDGGQRVFKASDPSTLDISATDWVWPCPSDWPTGEPRKKK